MNFWTWLVIQYVQDRLQAGDNFVPDDTSMREFVWEIASRIVDIEDADDLRQITNKIEWGILWAAYKELKK